MASAHKSLSSSLSISSVSLVTSEILEVNFNGFSSKTNNNNKLLDHIAFSRNDYSDFIQHITNLKISFNENFVPDSNTQQVFVKGPENLIIEIDFINP
jgi:hypothetical protein